jgi:DinB family protein
MSSRQEAIIAAVDRAHQELMELVRSATPEQWRTPGVNHPEIRAGEDEHRPAGVIAHHVATALATTVARCKSWIESTPIPPPTAEDNAKHEATHPTPGHAETVRLLDENVGRLKAYVRTLSDEDLEATGPFVRRELTVGQLLGETVPYHVRWHAESIRTTWEQASSG